jgi:hypothetical protein
MLTYYIRMYRQRDGKMVRHLCNVVANVQKVMGETVVDCFPS